MGSRSQQINNQTTVKPHKKMGSLVRNLLFFLIVVALVFQILFFSPSSLERDDSTPIESDEIIKSLESKRPKQFLAPGIPRDAVPEYSVEGFEYASTDKNQKEWYITSKVAHIYDKNELVHSEQIIAYLYNPEGTTTKVEGIEAKYFMGKKNLEVFGNVRTTFPDGFKVVSDYLRYLPDERKLEIPPEHVSSGEGLNKEGIHILFKSKGLESFFNDSRIFLKQNVYFKMSKPVSKKAKNSVADYTEIYSDQCTVYRPKNLAVFTMNENRADEDRFVKIHQPDLYANSRIADLFYGDFEEIINYMILKRDVLIQEKVDKELRYATGGQADFDTQKNLIVLKDYPQAYQGHDTIIGDIIYFYRDTDIIEVKESNAFSAPE